MGLRARSPYPDEPRLPGKPWGARHEARLDRIRKEAEEEERRTSRWRRTSAVEISNEENI